jgi:hypothetical protein
MRFASIMENVSWQVCAWAAFCHDPQGLWQRCVATYQFNEALFGVNATPGAFSAQHHNGVFWIVPSAHFGTLANLVVALLLKENPRWGFKRAFNPSLKRPF